MSVRPEPPCEKCGGATEHEGTTYSRFWYRCLAGCTHRTTLKMMPEYRKRVVNKKRKRQGLEPI